MGKRWVLCALIVMFGAVGYADTGGSMGGGDWSSSSSSGGGWSSSSSSSSSGWSSGDDWSSGSYSSSGGGGELDGAEVLVFLAVIVVWIVIAAAKTAIDGGFNSGVNAPLSLDLGNYAPIDSVDVSVLRIAVDGRARKFVQTELKQIADTTDTSTKDGRTAMLRQVALLLRRLKDAWVYGGAINEPMRDLGGAKPVFDRYVDDARSRFREETVRNEQGKKT